MELSEKQKALTHTISLLEYLQRFETNELIPHGKQFKTRTHNSLIIHPDGMWNWFSRGVGGYAAYRYLMEKERLTQKQAEQKVFGLFFAGQPLPPIQQRNRAKKNEAKPLPKKPFRLPKTHTDNNIVTAYLTGRGINREVINHCVANGTLYENAYYHSAVFVGRDESGVDRYGFFRSTEPGNGLRMDFEGSDKRYSFCITPAVKSSRLMVSECAIDALSLATLDPLWRNKHYLSLGGVSASAKLPIALETYLKNHPEIKKIYLCLDNDEIGRGAMEHIQGLLKTEYEVVPYPPKQGKDYNEYLGIIRGRCPQKNYKKQERKLL